MKKHTKIFATVGLCVLLVAGAWIANGAMRVQAQIANNLNPQDKSQTEKYLKKDSSAQIGTKENPFNCLWIKLQRANMLECLSALRAMRKILHGRKKLLQMFLPTSFRQEIPHVYHGSTKSSI